MHNQVYCKYCGMSFPDPQNLLDNWCQKNPEGKKHALCEDSEKNACNGPACRTILDLTTVPKSKKPAMNRLLRSNWGRFLIPLYYGIAGLAGILCMLVIASKFSALAGIIFALVFGIIIGIAGGEIEYQDHIHEEYRLRTRRPGVILKQRR